MHRGNNLRKAKCEEWLDQLQSDESLNNAETEGREQRDKNAGMSTILSCFIFHFVLRVYTGTVL